MSIRFQYFNNTDNVEYSRSNRIPRSIVYTMTTDTPNIIQDQFVPFDLFEDFNILNFFNDFENIVTNSFQMEQSSQKEKATKDQLSKLGPYHRVNKNSNLLKESCSICLDNFSVGEGYRTLICGHDFHKKCIDRWLLKGSQECPMCRKNAFELCENGEKENEC